jgi:mono/diheme cytochrome c family protein
VGSPGKGVLMSQKLKTVVATLLVEIVLVVVIALVVILSGIYDVAATKPHHRLTEEVLSTAMDRSVRNHAAGIDLSATYDSPDIDLGFEHYHEMCPACHGAPGVEKGEFGQGLNPPAPDLSESVTDLSPQEVFWILKNGIKMTGMPAFGPTHDDEKLWDITAFVKRLPEMTPEEYHQMVEDLRGNEPMDHHDP